MIKVTRKPAFSQSMKLTILFGHIFTSSSGKIFLEEEKVLFVGGVRPVSSHIIEDECNNQ